MRELVIGTRKSHLAITQSNWVRSQLLNVYPELSIELERIVTKGDKVLDVTLSKVGGKGLFVKEIEQALLDKQIDLAVHSLKDMPADLPTGLKIGCVPIREDVRDCLLSRDGLALEELPSGSVVGTSSLRRQAQVLAIRPDLVVESIRGNVGTRIAKLRDGKFDAIILAVSGLKRLTLLEEISEYFSVSTMLPAVGQGALAIECRSDDHEIIELLDGIHDTATGNAVSAERAFLQAIEGSCHLPVAGYATWENNTVHLTGLVASPTGKPVIKGIEIGADPIKVGKNLAQKLMEQGAKEILAMV
ncbi:hydroxymethylbilane synthase [Shimazuella alba]|jgi:hydroxymethylbilane synthase|uniref:Porphobilinogen deaminase n=1 Tax=Shimazuella alba TaxID=2690964 RepID=A0A6I4W123_9BACL|nr:hydroxymethylbilane synthase [Shimazuella alba]MXQ55885.1 hydroxymethylbilane synthase [Shimazuella alba]